MVGPCPCGFFHPHATHCSATTPSNSSFSLLWPPPAAHYYSDDPYSSAAAVDCTLSLGTPSTRRTSNKHNAAPPPLDRRSSSISNFCWDFLQPKHSSKSPRTTSTTTSGDPLVARRCANCDTTSTPLWRNGPRGPKSLCNACGIRFKKEERRATAAAATNAGGMTDGGYYHHQGQKMQSYLSPELRFMDDVEVRDSSDSGIQFLSWRLNVTERPTSLVHDFTR